MTVRFKIDLGNTFNKLDDELKKRTDLAIIELYTDIIKNSPVDTGLYLKGNKTKKAYKYGNKIIGKVYNDSKYSDKVEFGWREKPVNWYKNKKKGGPVIYTGIGARVFTRVFDNQENINKVKEIFNK